MYENKGDNLPGGKFEKDETLGKTMMSDYWQYNFNSLIAS